MANDQIITELISSLRDHRPVAANGYPIGTKQELKPSPPNWPKWPTTIEPKELQIILGDPDELKLILEIIQTSIRKTLGRIRRGNTGNQDLAAAFQKVVCKVIAELRGIAKTGLSAKQLIARVEDKTREIKKKHHAELASTREEHSRLKLEIAELAALSLQLQQSRITTQKYPAVPMPMQLVPEIVKTSTLPQVSAIYFAWREGCVMYVGQSVNIKNRCALQSHHNLHSGDWLSWIECPIPDLDFTESYYIGVCCPTRNFPGRQRSRKETQV